MTIKIKSRALCATFERSAVDLEARTVPMSVSSDSAEILRYVPGKGYGYEVLDHSSMSSIDLSRFVGDNGGPLLYCHDRSCIIGRFTPTEVSGGKLRGIARFGNSAKAEEAFRDVQDNILTDTSCYPDYDPEDVVVDNTSAVRDDYPTYRVTRWALTEVSLVPVPADLRTGVGREEHPAGNVPAGQSPTNHPAELAGTTRGESMQTPEEIAAAHKAAEDKAGRAAAIVIAPTVDPRAERMEAIQLRALADKLGLGRQADEILSADSTLPEARAKIMGLLAEAHPPALVPRSLEDMGASEDELAKYSYCRALSAAIDMQEGRSAKCFELEVAEDVRKSMPMSYKQRGGVFVPFQVRSKARAAMNAGTATGGKELVFTQAGELIELFRNMAVALKMGAQMLTGLQSPIAFPKQTGSAAAFWVPENGGVDVTETEPTTGLVTLSPHTLQATTAFSRQLLTLGTYSAEMMVRNDLALAHALAIDLATLHGDGTGNSPTGIYNAAGVNVLAMGGNPTWTTVVNMIAKAATSNALFGTLGWATNPLVAAKLMTTLQFPAAGATPIWAGSMDEGSMAGYKAMASNQVKANLGASTNENGMAFGNWAQVLIGLFGSGFEIMTDPYAKKKQGLIEVTSFEMADVQLRHPEAFTKATGMILT